MGQRTAVLEGFKSALGLSARRHPSHYVESISPITGGRWEGASLEAGSFGDGGLSGFPPVASVCWVPGGYFIS